MLLYSSSSLVTWVTSSHFFFNFPCSVSFTSRVPFQHSFYFPSSALLAMLPARNILTSHPSIPFPNSSRYPEHKFRSMINFRIHIFVIIDYTHLKIYICVLLYIIHIIKTKCNASEIFRNEHLSRVDKIDEIGSWMLNVHTRIKLWCLARITEQFIAGNLSIYRSADCSFDEQLAGQLNSSGRL